MHAATATSMQDESHWLASLDALRLECDGMTRVVSILLQRDGIAHTPIIGRLVVEGVGKIVPHCWIELEDGRRIDMRAKMWLGDDLRVPHGIVPADAPGVDYEGEAFQVAASPVVFWALTDTAPDAFAAAFFLQAGPEDRAEMQAAEHLASPLVRPPT